MAGFLSHVENVNNAVNGFVWGLPMLILLVGCGILMTCLTKFFQISHFKHWIRNTVGGIFMDKHITAHTEKEDTQISQFQSLCTALAATIGTGNIAGVAAAIAAGGPGAIFWMWVVAFFGMMTNFSENVLGIYYRRRNEKNEWCGGAMYYLRDGLGGKAGFQQVGSILAVLFSVFCVLASFGIGNMGQINSIAVNMESAFSVPPLATGLVLMLLAGLVIVGGLKRIAAVTERLVPFMAIIYVIGALVVCFVNIGQVGNIFASIFKGAFGMRAVGGGIVGSGVAMAVQWGMKRGVFSNEAGLGSSVMVHSSSNVREPVIQGMWGIFEVFADTMIVCTITAFSILSSGLVDLETGAVISDQVSTALVAQAFSTVFGKLGSAFIAVAILFFAFSTVLGWSQYGSKGFEYLFGRKRVKFYQVIFVVFIVIGATMDLTLAWDLSDTFNGMMAIPNLIGVIALSGTVMKITRNYVERKLLGKDVKPMLSADDEIQKVHEKEIVTEAS
ncbi:alanine or glycine:cation symporter, AGCS family [Butyrivibrio fibrisolvens DSM 3071]|uniref:Alanine or glycine:cation symporter, AGCS family n=1 Tax=Butyrivibrio fibrisolvens DSM 3071 TaxID=1121131 RepID=A0A1M6CP15_BUTFI|nr:alanine/glycine:cation symporter family protein [Butyrivibrio fibrisolvens]SHI62643.1 alanine or glycine:cation symporter, AGCS family [Butyrivibrio fibrisolvens DSM 3071]